MAHSSNEEKMNGKISITRKLNIHPAHMAYYAQYMAQQLSKELSIEWRWTTDKRIDFEAPSGIAKGTTGNLTFEGSTATIEVNLPFMLAPMRGKIECQINGRFEAIETMATRATSG